MCTRVFQSSNELARVVGRTFDFSGEAHPYLWWLPPGLQSRGGAAADALTWMSRMGSLVITELDGRCVDGVNEAGLAVHALMFTSAVYESPDDRPTLGTGMWVRFLLDTCSTVAEALTALESVRVTPDRVLGQLLGIHVAMEDASGDSAVVEPVGGAMVVAHGPEYRVMANSPSLGEHLANLARYRPFGGELPPPGDVTSLDRFVRASYFLHYVPEPSDARQAAVEVMQILQTVAKPLGVPYPDGDVYPTRWLSAVDLTNLDYYFWSRTGPAAMWLNMKDVAGSEVPLRADLMDPALTSDIYPEMLPVSSSSFPGCARVASG